jgi:hypothetical protein
MSLRMPQNITLEEKSDLFFYSYLLPQLEENHRQMDSAIRAWIVTKGGTVKPQTKDGRFKVVGW